MRRPSFSNSPFLKEAKKKKRKVLAKKSAIYASAFILCLIVLVLVSRLHKLSIEKIEVQGNKNIDSSEVESIATGELSGKYAWLFPKSNFLIYPKDEVKKIVASKFPIFSNIEASLGNLQTLVITVKEREGKYIWCGDNVPAEVVSELKCYFIDQEGYIFDGAPYFSGNVYLKFFGIVDEESDTPLGHYFQPNLFSPTVALSEKVSKLGIKVSSILIRKDGDIELYLSSGIPTQKSSKIKLKSGNDMDKTLENLESALATEPLHSDFKKKYSSLEYIDLRFGNKVYYRFK